MRRPPAWCTSALVIGLLHGFFTTAAYAQPYYQGKTIRIIVSQSPGGGFDAYSRALARHLGKYLPGNPATLVQNMPGAGNMIAVNYLYRVAKPDGLTIGNFVGGVVLEQLLARKGIDFDARRFEWIGVPIKYHPACVLNKSNGVTTLAQWTAAKTPVKIGGTGPGSTSDQIPRVLASTVGLPIQLVSGYKGTADIRLAAESGEVDGACFAWQSIKATWRKGIESGQMNVVVQTMPSAHPELANTPLVASLARSEEAKKLLQRGVYDPAAITLPYMLPPGATKERVQELRRAFQETVKDKDFLAEMSKAGLDIDPLSGEHVEKIVRGLFDLEKPLIAKLDEILYGAK
jgi:tripartite-type tricarboxylate transporter receptor subunit TctC